MRGRAQQQRRQRPEIVPRPFRFVRAKHAQQKDRGQEVEQRSVPRHPRDVEVPGRNRCPERSGERAEPAEEFGPELPGHVDAQDAEQERQ